MEKKNNVLWDKVEKARNEIKSFIVFEFILLYKALNKELPNFEEDEECEITDDELIKEVTISVCVYDTITDETYYVEHRHLTKVKVTLDENVFIETEGGDEEIEWTQLTYEELVDIAAAIQQTYENTIKQK